MLSRRTLLLADDSPTVQKVVSLTFADEGMEVLTASGGEEALARLGERVPDVLLADVHMPAPDGYELCARVKRDPRTARVPVLLLVGTFEPFDEAEARRVGADGVLTKPFQSIRELVSKVGGLIGGHHEQKPQPAAQEEAAAAAPEPLYSSEAEDVQPPPAFAAIDADDESIESVPADDYVAANRARAEDAAAEFVTADAPFAQGAAAGVAEVRQVEAAAVADASSFGAAAGTRAPGGYAASRFVAPQAESGFAPRPPQPPSDDSLLELGDPTPTQSRAAADFDDLILDIGDDTDGADAQAGASDSAEFLNVVDVDAEASEEPSAPAEISPANLSSAWSAAPRIEVPPARATFIEPLIDETEPPVDEVAAVESVEPEFEIEAETAVGYGSADEPAVVEPVETDDEPFAASAATPTELAPSQAARPEVAESRAEISGPRAHAPETSAGAAQFSPELVDAVARRVVELMSDRAVRDIAWEVVPDLAERLIRERLAQEK